MSATGSPARASVHELTAPLPGAVSVLALEGPGVLARLQERLLPGARAPRPGPPRLVRLRDRAGEAIDEALLWVLAEDRAELHLHGSRPLVARVLRELALGEPGAARDAATTLEARAEALLPQAASEAAARVLLDQAEGALRRALEEALAASGDQTRARLAELLARGRSLRPLFEPPLVLLAGPANAGKSTLFNLLLGRERALVHAAGGTTRDVLRERASLGEWVVELVDAAGWRDLAREPDSDVRHVEGAGQALAASLLQRADLVLWLDPEPGREVPREVRGARVQRWVSRADELAPARRAGLARALSAHEDPPGTRAAVAAGVREALDLEERPWVAGRAVPFDGPLLAALEGLLEEGEGQGPEALHAGLESLLRG